MLDNTNMHILKEITKNSRFTMKKLGKNVHLTGPATSARVAKLEDNGIIEGYTIKVNQVKMGYLVHAIIHIYTKKHESSTLSVVYKRTRSIHHKQLQSQWRKLLSSRMQIPMQ